MQLEVFTKKKIFWYELEKWYFWYGKKIHHFCSKIDNSKYLQNTKKFCTIKKFRILAFKDIRFSTQTQEMTEIWSNEKKVFKGGNIFFWLGVFSVFFEIISIMRERAFFCQINI